MINTVRCNDNSSLSLLLNRFCESPPFLRWAFASPVGAGPVRKYDFKKIHFSPCFFSNNMVLYFRFI